MTSIDLHLEQQFMKVGARPQRKFEETITKFDRNIFWYNRDTVARQAEHAHKTGVNKITYEDHRKAIETAATILGMDTSHDIAMAILSHRFFTPYRRDVFTGTGSFNEDYSFLIKKIAMIFDSNTSTILNTTYRAKLKEFTTPTLVSINHIAGQVTPMTPPSDKFTLNEWAIRYNADAVESTTYSVAGMTIGA